MNPFRDYVQAWERLYHEGNRLPVPSPVSLSRATSSAADTGPTALIFSPHPDDECIIGGLPLRLRKEAGWRVINVAVTLGSQTDRRAARQNELTAACQVLGFGLEIANGKGLESVRMETRRAHPHHWTHAVNTIGEILLRHRPSAIFFPHSTDAHPTHMGVHALVRHALHRSGDRLECLAFETEFWSPQEQPNLLAESTANDLATLIEALACHTGEVARNPYHRRLPAWFMDNVRRGAELVGGHGGAAPEFPFGTLYAMRLWRANRLHDILPEGVFLSASTDLPGFIHELWTPV